MRLTLPVCIASAICFLVLPAWAAEPQLTIYNQNFAVVRVLIPLKLKAGPNQIRVTDITAFLEPDSVILRDPTGTRIFQIVEQNYRADVISDQLLLSLNEGKTIDFLIQRGDKAEVVPGKIVRSGYVPQVPPYGSPYYGGQGNPGIPQQPIIEIDGKLRFGLPGTPLFPALADDTVLKPMLNWLLESDKPGETTAEFNYVTRGMSWNADYNLVAPEQVNNAQFGRVLGKVLGRPSLIPAPGFAFRLAFGEVAELVLEGRHVLPTRLQQAGFQFQYPTLESALRHIYGK